MPKVAYHAPRLQVTPYREAKGGQDPAARHAPASASRPPAEPGWLGQGLRLAARTVCNVTLLKLTAAAGLAGAGYLAAYRAVTPRDATFDVDHPLRWVPPVVAGAAAVASCRLVEGARHLIEGAATYAAWTPSGHHALPPMQRWTDRLQRANAQPLEAMGLAQTLADLINLQARHPDVIKPARLARAIADLGNGALDLRTPDDLDKGLGVLTLALEQLSVVIDASLCVSALRSLRTQLHSHPDWHGLERAHQRAIDAHIESTIRTINGHSRRW